MADIRIAANIIVGPHRLDQLKRIIGQLTHFNEVVIVDNSGEKGVRDLIKKVGTPFRYHKTEWRATWKNPKTGEPWGRNNWAFSHQRNEAIRQTSAEYMLWLDTDDIIGRTVNGVVVQATPEQAVAAFRKLAREREDIDLWFMKYVYGRDEDGVINATHYRERFMKMDARWEWTYPVHEVLTSGREVNVARVDDVEIHHLPTDENDHSSERNWELMNQWGEEMEERDIEDHHMARFRIIYGQTLWNKHLFREAADWLSKEYLGRSIGLNDLEKWQAWVWIARCQMARHNWSAASYAGAECIRLKPSLPDGYLIMAECKLAEEEDPKEVIRLIEMTGKCDDPPPEVIYNPLDYTFTPYCMVADAKLQVGEDHAALEWAKRALDIKPRDERAQALWAEAKKKVTISVAKDVALTMYQLYRDFDENGKAARFYEILPYPIQEDEEIKAKAIDAADHAKHMVDDEAYERFYAETNQTVPVQDNWFLEEVPAAERTLWIWERLQKSKAKHILDVGCADGFMTLWLARQGLNMIGTDLDKSSIKLAQERAEKYEISAKFFQGFFEKMDPAKTECPMCPGVPILHHFDAAMSCEVLEHVQNPGLFVGALSDCVKPGGPVLLTTPNGAYDAFLIQHQDLECHGHVRAYTQNTLEQLLTADPEHHVTECHFIKKTYQTHDEQGWLAGEIVRRDRPNGPIVRIVCGDRGFHPDKIWQEGIGGSETAAVKLAQGLAVRDCQVVVYTGAVGIWDGVFYRKAEDYNSERRSDLMIGWRFPHLFRERHNAAVTVLWNHDTDYWTLPDGFPDEWVENVDRVACLSEAHREHFADKYPNLASKIFVTRNGIDPERFLGKQVERKQHRYFYSSSWDRGLKELLDVWPTIKEIQPDAELKIAYGYELYLKYLNSIGKTDAEVKELLSRIKSLDGVDYVGKLNQDELADLMLSCQGWLYPPHPFQETYCITALEAMAAGCIPISRTNGALKSTLKHLIPWEDLRQTSQIFQGLESLWFPEWTETNRKWAMSQSWDSLAEEWLIELAPREALTV